LSRGLSFGREWEEVYGLTKAKKIVAVLFAFVMLAAASPTAFAAAPGPGDKQCRGATGNDNPHCPPG
jgi:hypothetical protein